MIPIIPIALESKWVRYGLACAVGVWLIAGAYWIGMRNGSRQAHAEDASRYASELAKANDKYRAREKEHADEIDSIRLSYAKKDATELAKDAVSVIDIRRRATPMRVRIVPASCPNPAATGTAPSGGDANPQAELAREDSTEIYDVAAYGDETARQLELIQKWAYEAVRLCNGGKL